MDRLTMQFHVLSRTASVPSSGRNAVYLKIDHWDDYSFVTMFEVHVYDERRTYQKLENVKIGFVDQTEGTSTYSMLESTFQKLPSSYFSLGTDVEYYKSLMRSFSTDFRSEFLSALRDVAFDPKALEIAAEERVFANSHLRFIALSTVTEQFRRILAGGVITTDFKFRFELEESETFAGFTLDFIVNANSTPSTNIHAIIGRNGVGKTTLLNGMISAIMDPNNSAGEFQQQSLWTGHEPLDDGYFSSIVSVSFSAFDPFAPPPEQSDPTKGVCYYYVGLKDIQDHGGTLLKPLTELHTEFVERLVECLSEPGKRNRWLAAVETLESDSNFAEMGLREIAELPDDAIEKRAIYLIKKMSSGHAAVLLIITKLVSRVEEKTLVLIDEPESHLHPPLLAALVRSLSMLLHERNAVAIVATHSPVVLQEVPKSCVWKITRSGLAASWKRPDVETFGENVGILTREVFGLEVSKSGFNALLEYEVGLGKSYEEIVDTFDGQLGFEARAILRSLTSQRA